MSSQVHRFADFRLDPAARELWRGPELLSVPSRVFDALTYLIEHRDRAVGRDELISALWGRVDVADRQVAQLIMRVRHVIGQNGDGDFQAIRTVHGFGYRWIGEIETASVAAMDECVASEAATGNAERVGTATSTVILAEHASRHRRSANPLLRGLSWAGVVALLGLVVVGAVLESGGADSSVAAPPEQTPERAVAVLPIEVATAGSTDAAWMRLGIMDLVAERLRRAGLSVPASDGVVSAVHVTADLAAAERQAILARMLVAEVLIEGRATPTATGWAVEFTTIGNDTMGRRSVQAEADEIVPAANRAADLLLALLGKMPPPDDGRDEALSELLQRAKAAMLAQEIDTARRILANAPESMRSSPALRVELALAEQYMGRFRESEAITGALLDDPELAADPSLHSRALIGHGNAVLMAAGNRHQAYRSAASWFDAAVTVAEQAPWTSELANALAIRSTMRILLHEFDAAVFDLGRARALFAARKDGLGLARVHNYFGLLEVERGRLAEALPHYRAAVEINESHGHVRRLIDSLSGLLRVQIEQLHWRDALATVERLQSMGDRITDPVWRHAIGAQQATVLIALGRHEQAAHILTVLGTDTPSLANVCEDRAKVRLAWQQGRLDETRLAADAGLERWASSPSQGEGFGDIVLLRQRAALAAGTNPPALTVPDLAAGGPAYLVAGAERALESGDPADAERLFRQAVAQAESRARPAEIVLVADAYGHWLIGRGRLAEASAVAGRVADWAEHDYDSALLQVAVLRAGGQHAAWLAAVDRAQALAGEREIPAVLLDPPGIALAEAFEP